MPAQHDIELALGKTRGGGISDEERRIDASQGRLAARGGDHLGSLIEGTGLVVPVAGVGMSAIVP